MDDGIYSPFRLYKIYNLYTENTHSTLPSIETDPRSSVFPRNHFAFVSDAGSIEYPQVPRVISVALTRFPLPSSKRDKCEITHQFLL